MTSSSARSVEIRLATRQISLAVVLLVCAVCAPEPGNQSPDPVTPHVFFVTGDDEYSSELTMPVFANELEANYDMRATVLSAYPDEYADNIPGLETLAGADLAVFFLRNRVLPTEQVEHIRGYIDSGKPVVSIRTSTHAFLYPEGHELEEWNEFGPRVVGAPYVWDYGHNTSTDVSIAEGAAGHAILRGVEPTFHVRSWLYKLIPDYPTADSEVLLMGFPPEPNVDEEAGDPAPNAVAWTRHTETGGRVFTTTMGHPEDLRVESLQRLIINGIHWALGKEVPLQWAGSLPIDVPYKQEDEAERGEWASMSSLPEK